MDYSLCKRHGSWNRCYELFARDNCRLVGGLNSAGCGEWVVACAVADSRHLAGSVGCSYANAMVY
jgi:hypothetical protein